MDIKEMENADFDVLENIKVACRQLWKQKVVVALCMLIAILISVIYIVLKGQSTYYTSTASIFSVAYGDANASYSGISAMNSKTNLIGSTRVCERAANMLTEYGITASEIKEHVNSGRIIISGAGSDASSYGSTLYISVYCEDSNEVIAMANAMASAYSSEVNDLIGTSVVQVMDEARSYGRHNTLNIPLFTIIAAAVGMLMSVAFIFLKSFFNPYVMSVEQCERNKDKVLGMIPYDNEF